MIAFSLSMAFLTAVVLFLGGLWLASRFVWSRGKLPPGPPGLPIIGNLLDVPTTDTAATYHKLCEKYGDLVYLDAFGQPILIVGTHAAAVDLLEKRSALYSDRLPSAMIELGGFDWVLTVLRYGPWWRRHRRAFHRFFNVNAVASYRSLQRVQIVHFLRRLLKTPDDFAEHIRHLFAATITRIAYGTEIKEKDDEFVRLAEDGLLAFNTLLAPGKYLVELFPSLRFVPAWCPGAKFKREAARARVTVRNVLQLPWAHTLDAMSNGSVKNSMVTAFMEHIVQLHGQEAVQETEVAQNTVAVAYAAGADTTLSSIQAFFSIMASCPEVQRKAQAELDVVVGSTRLPDSPDIDALPYVSAVIKECLRWHTVVPLAVPHRLIEDDKYRGYLIPKGTLVIPNVWAFSHDPISYPSPFDFKPERFMKDGRLDPDILDPSEYAFGYGRRICPGQQFAQSSLFLIVSTVLHTMSITSPEGEDAGSRQLRAKGKVSDGIISYPEPFDCVITPRGLWAETLVLNGL